MAVARKIHHHVSQNYAGFRAGPNVGCPIVHLYYLAVAAAQVLLLFSCPIYGPGLSFEGRNKQRWVGGAKTGLVLFISQRVQIPNY